MIIRVVGLFGDEVQTGDEIAVYDGDHCVGAAVVEAMPSKQNRVDIVTSMDDDAGDGIINGFASGGEISFRYWDADTDTETADIAPAYVGIQTGEPVSPPTFQAYGDFGVYLTLGSEAISLDDLILALQTLTGGYFNPINTHADADRDGVVELSDAVYLLQTMAGLRP